jgi:hypothetical protein
MKTVRRRTLLDLQQRRARVPISHAHLTQPHPLVSCCSTPESCPGPSLNSFGLTLYSFIGFSFIKLLPLPPPLLLATPPRFIGYSVFYFPPHPLYLPLIGPIHTSSPALIGPCRLAVPSALGLRRGQGAPAALSSRLGFGRSRGGAPPRMRSRSIDLVPDTGRPRRRSCCRSSET